MMHRWEDSSNFYSPPPCGLWPMECFLLIWESKNRVNLYSCLLELQVNRSLEKRLKSITDLVRVLEQPHILWASRKYRRTTGPSYNKQQIMEGLREAQLHVRCLTAERRNLHEPGNWKFGETRAMLVEPKLMTSIQHETPGQFTGTHKDGECT